MKNLKSIYILPRVIAERDLDDSLGPYLLISICDNGFPAVIPRRGLPIETLRLEFVDWDTTRNDSQILNETMFGKRVEDSLVQPAHAQALKEFLGKHSTATTLVVNCLAGISRSVSTGMAICDAFGVSRGVLSIYTGKSPYGVAPNQMVYSTLFEGLRC